jgi:hypothetical protein
MMFWLRGTPFGPLLRSATQLQKSKDGRINIVLVGGQIVDPDLKGKNTRRRRKSSLEVIPAQQQHDYGAPVVISLRV